MCVCPAGMFIPNLIVPQMAKKETAILVRKKKQKKKKNKAPYFDNCVEIDHSH
jgi:hypothetical protein